MSLINTLKLEIRAKLPNPVEREEWRFTRYGLLTAVKEMTASPESIINSDIKQKASVSEGRALKIPVFKIGDVTVKNARSCSIGDLENTTEMVTVSWVTLVADISMQKSEHHVNEVSYLEDLNKKLLRVDHAFAKAVETMIDTKLDTEKSQVQNSTLVGAGNEYPFTANTIEVPANKQEHFFNDMGVIMEENDFYSMPFKVLGSTTLKSYVNKYYAQGEANSVNQKYQFGDFDYRFSNHLTNAAGKKATGYVMPNGDLGIMTRINIDAEMGNKAGDGTEWSKTNMPIFGYDVGVMYKSKCDDLSDKPGLSHLEASMVENWQFSVDVALLTPYNSNPATLPSAINKFEFQPAVAPVPS